MSATPTDLGEAQRLCDAASPGPWTVEATGGRDVTGEGWYQVEISFADPIEPHAGLMLGDHENADADAEFIAAARSLVPALAAELVGLRADNEQLQHQVEQVTGSANVYKGNADQLRDALADAEREIERLGAELQTAREQLAELKWAEMLTNQSCAAGKHPDWFVDSEFNHPCPWCELVGLRAEVTDLRQQAEQLRAEHRLATGLIGEHRRRAKTARADALIEAAEKRDAAGLRGGEWLRSVASQEMELAPDGRMHALGCPVQDAAGDVCNCARGAAVQTEPAKDAADEDGLHDWPEGRSRFPVAGLTGDKEGQQ